MPKIHKRVGIYFLNLIFMKSKSTMFLLWLLTGMWGGHRFYVGKTSSAVLYFFTGGFCVFGWLLDFFKLDSMVEEYNARLSANQPTKTETNNNNDNNNNNTNNNTNANNIVVNLGAPMPQYPQYPQQPQYPQYPQQPQQPGQNNQPQQPQ